MKRVFLRPPKHCPPARHARKLPRATSPLAKEGPKLERALNLLPNLITLARVILVPAVPVKQGDLLALGNPHDQLVAIGEVVNVLREGGPVEVKPKVVLAG